MKTKEDIYNEIKSTIKLRQEAIAAVRNLKRLHFWAKTSFISAFILAILVGIWQSKYSSIKPELLCICMLGCLIIAVLVSKIIIYRKKKD